MIKKLFAVITYCALNIITAYAAEIKTTINCTVHGPKGSSMNLYALKDGNTTRVGSQQPDANGNCTFNVPEKKEGVYFFAKAGGKSSDYKFVIYLKAGDKKQIDFYLEQTSVDYDSCVVNKPNPETAVIQKWTTALNSYAKSVFVKSDSTYIKYSAFEKKAGSFLTANKTSNVFFNNWMKDKVNTDLKYLRAANFFGFGKRLNRYYDSSAVVKNFYKPLLDKGIVSNPGLLRSEHGLDLLNYVFAYWEFNKRKSGDGLAMAPFSENLKFITSNEVKAAYLVYKMQPIKTYEDFVKQVQPYKALLIKEEHKAAYQKKYEELYLFAKGTPGYNFELKDVNDKTYTLAGFKGKVVVIDMWAMWCAPCLAEKPVMEKIAHELKDRNDIVFVGVSVDGLNRREIWKGFVKKNGFTSIELLSNATESIQKYYRIEGIPRFLIFDREGKIVSVDAPMPSSGRFKKIVDDALAAK
ncbi:TlpA disulfide reductase family protein [Pedobacter nyackensis]|uniref:TlpA family protein disulfide reductase n=1 Tax=Pedobacter nyackensis TaxID=475255 RepID=UPI00292F5A9F|nr:TlpA disulfide reductase family protein [Pedobacter nyackensis]